MLLTISRDKSKWLAAKKQRATEPENVVEQCAPRSFENAADIGFDADAGLAVDVGYADPCRIDRRCRE